MTENPIRRQTAVFLHVATLGRYNEVLTEALNAITKSDLCSELDLIEVNVVGDGEIFSSCEEKKINIIRRSSSVTDFEHPTLTRIQEYCRVEPGSAILYINCLGGRYEGEGYEIRKQWRKLLYFLLVERHQHCMRLLNDYDVCGVSWSRFPMPHMTSNNWWANANYILTLPTPAQGADIVSMNDLSEFGSRWTDAQVKKRHSGEFWIGMDPNVKPADTFTLETLGLPRGEFKSVSWWALPGINWEAVARRKLESDSPGKLGFSFYKLVAYFQIRWALKSFKRALARLLGREVKANTAV